MDTKKQTDACFVMRPRSPSRGRNTVTGLQVIYNCLHDSQEFMLCYAEEKDPRKCLNEGKEVTRCGIEFFQNVRENCAEEFTKYWKCLDYGASYDMNLR